MDKRSATKRKNSSILIFSIFSAQLTTALIIYKLYVITNYPLFWTVVYYVVTFFCAIPQAGLSDSYGRKRHLLISCYFVTLSGILLLIIYIINKSVFGITTGARYDILALPICLVLGIAGNTIPIARAGISDLKIHDFRTAMGWTTLSIGFGWGTAVILGLLFPGLEALIFSTLLQLFIIYLVRAHFYDQEDLSLKRKPHLVGVVANSYKWLGKMFLVGGGAAAILAYLFAETTFYQIYSLDEDGAVTINQKVIGILMAVGYSFGVIIQWITAPTNKKGIKRGIAISVVSLVVFVITQYLVNNKFIAWEINVIELIYGSLQFIFALGYGFSIPSLFALMSKKIKSHHSGKLFGVIDSTDTLALSVSFFLLFIARKFMLNSTIVNLITLIAFVVSATLYIAFIRRFTTYERADRDKR